MSHLKLLAAIGRLQYNISTSVRLSGINNEAHKFSGKKRNLTIARIREKRWAVYVSKAVDRSMVWWERCVPASEEMAEISWTPDTLPPIGESYYLCPYWFQYLTSCILDVLMVWYLYMLHPCSLLTDCLRGSRMGFWASGLPWEAMGSCIEEKTYRYYPENQAIWHFKAQTGRAWDNVKSPPSKTLACLWRKEMLDA